MERYTIGGTSVSGGSIQKIACGWWLCALSVTLMAPSVCAADHGGFLFKRSGYKTPSAYEQRQQVIAELADSTADRASSESDSVDRQFADVVSAVTNPSDRV